MRADSPTPDWWRRRRYGLLIQTSLAAVPAWAPLGQSADWYRAHMGDNVSDTLLYTSPLAETLRHHRDRWDHIERFDDFVPFLNFVEFNPDDWATAATGAGMRYLIMTAKHHDGWCWWDAPNTERTLTDRGPCRNVLAEVAEACRDHDLVFGAAYSLLDWGDDRHLSVDYVDNVVHPHLFDLVERYGVEVIRGDGHWGAGGEFWRSDDLIEGLRRRNPNLVLNNRFWASEPGVRSLDMLTTDDQPAGDWELYVALGTSHGYNRAERADSLMQPDQIVALLTEVVAKRGHLVISVGPAADGRLPAEQVRLLAEAGAWIRAHDELIHRSTPWEIWGDANVRYLMLDDQLYAIDVARGGIFAALSRPVHTVKSVSDEDGNAIAFSQDENGLRLSVVPTNRRHVQQFPTVYRVDLEPDASTPIELFADSAVGPANLADALSGAQPGDVVQLGEGVYQGSVRVPDGVTLRGLGADRTILDGDDQPAVALGDRSRLEHCRVVGGGSRIAWLPRTVALVNGDEAHIFACDIDGHIGVTASNRARIASCNLVGIVVAYSSEVSIVRSIWRGMGWDCAIDITGGEGHLIDSNDLADALQAIRLTGTVGTVVRNNTVQARWWGVQLVDAESTRVLANAFERTMRAVDVDGGADNEISGNAVTDGDSGCVIQRGAAHTEVTGNHWERCRVGLLAWDAGPFRSDNNTAIDIADEAEVTGP